MGGRRLGGRRLGGRRCTLVFTQVFTAFLIVLCAQQIHNMFNVPTNLTFLHFLNVEFQSIVEFGLSELSLSQLLYYFGHKNISIAIELVHITPLNTSQHICAWQYFISGFR